MSQLTDSSVRRRPRARTKKDVVTEFRNAAILDAARRVFAAAGFEGASVDEIARAAGVAKGTVYLYYPSKEAVYQAAMREGLLALAEELRRQVEAAATVREKIRAFVETKVAYFDRNRDFFKIYLAAFADLATPRSCPEEMRSLYRRQLDILEVAFRAAEGRERIRRGRPADAALAVFDLTRGVVTRRLLAPSRPRPDNDVELLLDLIWKGLAGR
jgi:AcrR family transcriptional regulator